MGSNDEGSKDRGVADSEESARAQSWERWNGG